MKLVALFLSLATLAACGADGAPVAPASMAATPVGVSVSGCAQIGITTGPITEGKTDC